MEGSLKAHPLAHLDETGLQNLASLYELSSSDASAGGQKKRALSAWAAQFAPDDVDLSVIRTD